MSTNLVHQPPCAESLIALGTIETIVDLIVVLKTLKRVTHEGKDGYEPDSSTPVSRIYHHTRDNLPGGGR